MEKRIAMACDHAGYELKESVKTFLVESGYDIEDFGTHTAESVDYPDFIHPMASAISEGLFKKGIIICGTGNGVSMTANKYPNVRAALCWNEELVIMARQHNDANILALPARHIEKDLGLKLTKLYLNTEFEGGRHQRRVEKINIK